MKGASEMADTDQQDWEQLSRDYTEPGADHSCLDYMEHDSQLLPCRVPLHSATLAGAGSERSRAVLS
jgi:hypothetical protein